MSGSPDPNVVLSIRDSDEIPPELKIDEKESQLHRLDSLSLLLYTFLLTVTVLTIWMFKHRRVRYLHETGLAIIYGFIIGKIVDFKLFAVQFSLGRAEKQFARS